jgi:hypothetical protein
MPGSAARLSLIPEIETTDFSGQRRKIQDF